jgi:anti-anti-sigma factor
MRADISGLTWVALDGELDLAGAGLVGGDLLRICDASDHLVIDARALTFVDLTGLRLLAGLERRQRDRGARFALVAGDAVRRLARLGELQALLDAERHPDDLLGLVGIDGTAPLDAAPWHLDPPADHRRHLRLEDGGDLRDRVASECARQAALVATMASLAGRAQTALDLVRGTSRAAAERRARRGALR